MTAAARLKPRPGLIIAVPCGGGKTTYALNHPHVLDIDCLITPDAQVALAPFRERGMWGVHNLALHRAYSTSPLLNRSWDVCLVHGPDAPLFLWGVGVDAVVLPPKSRLRELAISGDISDERLHLHAINHAYLTRLAHSGRGLPKFQSIEDAINALQKEKS